MCICIKCGCFSGRTTSEREEKETVGCLDILLAIFVPPAGIYKKEGCSGRFWVNVALTVLGVAPGSIHAVVCVSSN